MSHGLGHPRTVADHVSRPKSLDDVAAQEHTVQVLQRTLQATNLPHMLFYGPPGTGKTSTILALAKQLYGPVLYPSRVLELNASDERGISIVREKVKDFARQQLSNPPPGDYTSKYPCPPYKIIVLDEADSMTQDAQSALRRTMETYSKITRFCLVCNYVTRIIDPLASRCSKFRFKSLDSGSAKKRLEEIAKAEGVKMEEGVVDTLISASEGDLRKAITFLQSGARLAGTGNAAGAGANGDAMDIDTTAEGTVTKRSIEEIAGVIPVDVIGGLWQAMQPQGKGATYTAVAKAVTDMVADGWSAGQAVGQVCISAYRVRTSALLTRSNSSSKRFFSMRWLPISRRTKLRLFSRKLTKGWWMAQTNTLKYST